MFASTLLVLSAVLLIGLPVAARRFRADLAPRVWAQTTLWTTAAGVGLLEAAAIVCSLPLLARVAGTPTTGHFFPGGDVAGWISVAIAVLLPMRVLIVMTRLGRRRRLLRAEPWLGSHVTVDGVDVAVLALEQPMAFAVPGRRPQIVISDAALRLLSDDELSIILRHEQTHLENHHSRYLAWVEVLRPLLDWVPIIRDGVTRLPVWLERWADDESAPTPEERASIRSSLLRFAVTDLRSAATSMSPVETILQRVEALDREPVSSAWPALVAIVGAAVLLLAVGLTPLLARLF